MRLLFSLLAEASVEDRSSGRILTTQRAPWINARAAPLSFRTLVREAPGKHLLLGDPSEACCLGVRAGLAARGYDARIVANPLTDSWHFSWWLDTARSRSSVGWDGQTAFPDEGAQLVTSVTSQECPVEHREDAPAIRDWVVLEALRVRTCRQFPELCLRALGVDVIDFAFESDGGD